MFTGIIETLGKVVSISPKSGGMALSVCLGSIAEGVKLGDSIAVNGVCLTATRLAGGNAHFDVSGESLSHTTIKTLRIGQWVNLERAMQAGGRFGGHIVQGHIDGTGKISDIQKQGDFAVFTIESPAELVSEIIVKGSIALDGISLTIASAADKTFTVAMIPETLSRTIWGQSKVGDVVNIETDILVKAVRKQLERLVPNQAGLTIEKLKDMGF